MNRALNASTHVGSGPAHAQDELAQLGIDELVSLLIAVEDRAPRYLVDECARRGEDMIQLLANLAADYRFWEEEDEPGLWWLGLHAVMILGLMSNESAGRLLVDIMRRMDEVGDDDIQDWCAGNWPALFRNKPDSVLPALRELVMDREVNWYMRANAMEPLVAAAERRNPAALDDALDRVAGIITDENEDWDTRLSAAHLLLDFPRARHRPLLEMLVTLQDERESLLSLRDIESAYTARKDEPQWLRFTDPWQFYSPDAIAERQARWAKESAAVRSVFKIGRNDPCPCGSGKKYKKCCLSG